MAQRAYSVINMAQGKGTIADTPARISPSRIAYVVIVLTALTLLGTAVYYFFWRSNTPSSTTSNTQQPDSPLAVTPKSTLSASGLYVGEVFWGRGIEYFARRSSLGYAFPFSGLSSETKAKYNNWIGDLECPVTSTDVPYQTQVDYLQHHKNTAPSKCPWTGKFLKTGENDAIPRTC
jgi:hypothetical protein